MRNYIGEINRNYKNSMPVGDLSHACYDGLSQSARSIYNPTRIDLISSLKSQNRLFCAMLAKWRHLPNLKNRFLEFKSVGKEELVIGVLTVCNIVISGVLILV